MKGLTIMFLVMLVSVLIASLWSAVPMIKNSVHFVLNPTAGKLLDWNVTFGMFIIVFAIALIIILAHKYTTDQEALREMKKEQKAIQQEMKQYKDNPSKLMELNKKSFEIMPKMMGVSMRPLIFTAIPIILFFRWFNDYFTTVEFRFLGYLSWFWFYLIFSILFSTILRKVLKVA